MKPLNFFRYVVDRENRAAKRKKTYVPNRYLDLLIEFSKAPKFLMPLGGFHWESDLQNLPEDFILPYPKTVVEFEEYLRHDNLKAILGEEFQCNVDADGVTDVLMRNLVLARQTEDGKITIDHISHISIPSRGIDNWGFPPFSAELSNRRADFHYGMDPERGVKSITMEMVNFRHDEVYGNAKELIDTSNPELMEEFETVGLSLTMFSSAYAIYALMEMLSFSNVSTETLPAQKTNKSANKRGALGFDEYKILTIQVPEAKGVGVFGSHRSPREHTRRAHVRKYRSGKTTLVPACIVNAGVGGKIFKQYQIK